MASLVLSISIGRRPYHDSAIDNLAVSGDHAALVRVGKQLFLEDGGSTNGTKINGQTVENHPLKNGDVIEIGKYHLKYFKGKTAHIEPAAVEMPAQAPHYVLKILNGKQAGIEVPLAKPLTSLGKKNVQVAIITRHNHGYFINHVEGRKPIVNGATINERPFPRHPGGRDRIGWRADEVLGEVIFRRNLLVLGHRIKCCGALTQRSSRVCHSRKIYIVDS